MTTFPPPLDSILRCSGWVALIAWSLMTRPQPADPDIPEPVRIPNVPCRSCGSQSFIDSPGSAVHRLTRGKKGDFTQACYFGNDSEDEAGKPTADEVLKCLPASREKDSLVFRTSRENVRIACVTIEDSFSEPLYFPNIGPARRRKLHFKCTVVYDRVRRYWWPMEYLAAEGVTDVVYYDRDRVIPVDPEEPDAR